MMAIDAAQSTLPDVCCFIEHRRQRKHPPVNSTRRKLELSKTLHGVRDSHIMPSDALLLG